MAIVMSRLSNLGLFTRLRFENIETVLDAPFVDDNNPTDGTARWTTRPSLPQSNEACLVGWLFVTLFTIIVGLQIDRGGGNLFNHVVIREQKNAGNLRVLFLHIVAVR